MKSYSEERFCVYTHNDAEGNVKYVGSGVKARAYKIYAKSGTNKLIQKRFYVRVHGYEKALELATKERAKMLSEIEQRLNIIYSDSHK